MYLLAFELLHIFSNCKKQAHNQIEIKDHGL
jgi:hypothetical protein